MCYSNSEIDVPVLCADVDIPIYWWDSEADRCLLVGVFKHGKRFFSFKGIVLKGSVNWDVFKRVIHSFIHSVKLLYTWDVKDSIASL